jgi:bacterioferritin-associated ferredoxin
MVKERSMTRCECAGLSFEEIARIAERERIAAFELIARRTGCASTCTACTCDLVAFLARRREREPVGAAP